MKRTERILSFILLFILLLSNFATPVSYAAETVTASQSVQAKQSTTPAPQPTFHQPDSGSVLGASTSLFEIGSQSLNEIGTQGSADKRIPIRMQQLDKRVYQTDEDVTLAVTNPDNDPFSTSVVNSKGQTAAVPITETNDGTTTTVQIAGSNEITPGQYTIKVTDNQGNVTTQDFTWGVLALNTDKSIYHPGETANISMGVLNNQGDMVCDADLTLKITNQAGGISDTLVKDASPSAKAIIVNPQCQLHDFSLQPDYQAQYTFAKKGTYTMQLTATTSQGTHTITSTVPVTDQIPFDVQRVSATRIYPPNTYPMTINITAHQDFSGVVTETVPQDFTITPATESATTVTSYANMQTMYLDEENPAVALQQAINASGSGGLVMPFHGNYPITQGFGAQLTDPTLQAFYTQYGLAGHDGVDFGVPMNTPLYAVDDGDIIWSGPGDYGTTIIIQHSWGESYYGHLSTTAVNVGTHVLKGQLIGYSGESGEATGPHLHFGMKPINPDMTNGYYGKVDPLPYLPYNNQATQSLSALDPNLTQSVLSASTSADSNTDASNSAAVSPTLMPSVSPEVSPSATPSATIPQPTNIPTPTGATQQTTITESATPPDNTNFTVLNKQILLSEQLANNSETEKVKVLTWNVTLKKGETTSLGYDYQAPRVSPQFYLMGPIQFYQNGSNKVVFQEQRQWEIASDDVGVEWYQNTNGNKWNGYSWQYRKKLVIDHTKVDSMPQVTFMDSGGDATNATTGDTKLTATTGGFYNTVSTSAGSTVTYDTSTKETGPGSIKFTSGTSGASAIIDKTGILADSGRRISAYINFTNLPSTGRVNFISIDNSGESTDIMDLDVTSAGVLQLWNADPGGSQIGSSGMTLSAGTWYRIDISYKITSTTNYSVNVYVNGTQTISYSQTSGGTALAGTGTGDIQLGWDSNSVGNSEVMNMDDIYIDSGTDLSDTGDIHVTAKRPTANGASSQFTTQIGTGNGSGYPGACTWAGGCHAGQVNERPQSITNGVSIGTNSKTEEYTIEGASVGDVDISSATIIASGAWIYAKGSGACAVANPASIVNNGATNAINLSTTATMFTNYLVSSTYSSGNTAVGMVTCSNGTAVTTSLYEAGVQVAYSAGSITTPGFPVLVSLTSDSDLSTKAQGSGNDILFTDSTGRNLLPFEIEHYLSGTLTAWVDTPLSLTSDSIIYMYYGNPSATTSLANATGIWDSNYKGVWHMYEGSGAITHDSTANANNGALTGTGGPGWTTGQIGNAINFVSSSSDQIDNAGSNASLDNLTSGFTVDAWFNSTITTSSADRQVVGKIDGDGKGSGWAIYYDALDRLIGFTTSDTGVNDLIRETSTSTVTNNTWTHVIVTWDGSLNASSVHIYINDVEPSYQTTQNGTTAYSSDSADNLDIGNWANLPGANENFVGNIDEVRVSNTIRSAGWEKTAYNNESAPGPGGFVKTLGNVETDIYAPTMSELMRNGEWFDSTGKVQPFNF